MIFIFRDMEIARPNKLTILLNSKFQVKDFKFNRVEKLISLLNLKFLFKDCKINTVGTRDFHIAHHIFLFRIPAYYFAIWKSRDPTNLFTLQKSKFLVKDLKFNRVDKLISLLNSKFLIKVFKINIVGTRDFHIAHYNYLFRITAYYFAIWKSRDPTSLRFC